MKKFSFDLQKLLEYRKTIEEQLLAELSAMRMELRHEKARLQEINATKCRFIKKMKGDLVSGSPEDIRDAYGYLKELGRRVETQELLIVRTEEKIVIKTDAVVAASKEVKALERLREQKRLQYRRELEEQEQKFLDEIASIRFNRTGVGDECATGSAA